MAAIQHKNISDAESHSTISDADNDTKIQCEESADEDIIRVDIAGVEQFNIQDGKIEPTLDNDIDLGSATNKYKNIHCHSVVVNSVSTSFFIPEGVIVPWCPGYFADGANGTYTNVLGAGNTILDANTYLNPLGWYVCDGSAVNNTSSTIFNGAGRYLPNLTDRRFISGYTAVGGIGGTNSSAHTHSHNHSSPAHYHGLGTLAATTSNPGNHTHLLGTTSGGGSGSGATFNTITAYNGTMTSAGAHTHTITFSGNIGATTGSNGDLSIATDTDATAASATDNKPLYLDLFYIMKII